MRNNGYLWTSGVNLYTAVRFADPDFSDLATFFVDFLHSICWMSAIFLLPVCLTSWPRKYTTRVDPHVDNSHQVWSWHDHTLPSYSVFVCRHVTWPCDLDLWSFDLENMSCMANDVVNLATKYEDPMPIRSWVTSYNVSWWLPLKMRTRPLRMRRITWPMSGGEKRLHFWNPRPRFAYSLCHFYWATTTIKGRLLSSVINAKALDCVIFFVRDFVTLTFDRLTLNSCLSWRVPWPTLPPNLKTLRLFVHELRVITVPIG